MEIELNQILDDWRDYECCICREECNPGHRFCYSSDATDKRGNPLINDEELVSCGKCKPKLMEIFGE